MKKIIYLFLLISLVSSCSQGQQEIIENEVQGKKDFFIETKKFSDFSNNYEIKKTGKIVSSQDIILSSKASGMVSSIDVKAGDKVYPGSGLISLSDNTAAYYLNYEKSKLALESAKLSYEQNKIALDKQVQDTGLNFTKLKKDYELLQKTWEENIASAKIALENSQTGNSDSMFSNSTGNLSKAELDYNKLIESNKEQIKSFETTAAKDYLNLKNLFNDIIDFSDRFLGVTDLNEEENDSFEDYIGAKNSSLRKELEKDLLNLIVFNNNQFNGVDENGININNLNEVFVLLDEGYAETIEFLDKLETIFDYSIENVYFSASTISSYRTQINSYQSVLQGNYSSFLTFKSTVQNFLNTYKTNEDVLKKQLNISLQNAEINYNKTLIDAESSLSTMETNLESAKIAFETAKKNREASLKTLENQIALSKNASDISYKEYLKLFIKSPIAGVVSDVIVSKGQDVNNGTQVIKLSSLSNNEIEIGLSAKELNFVQTGKKVSILYGDVILDGYISSISPVADDNLNYKIKINIDTELLLGGDIVEVIIPTDINKKLINISAVTILEEGTGKINTFSGKTLEKVEVNLGQFLGDMVEITGCVDLSKQMCDDLSIITNNISNYDQNKFNLIEKK